MSGAKAASKSIIAWPDHPRHRRPVQCAAPDRPSGLDAVVPGAHHRRPSACCGFIIGIWADGFEKLQICAAPDHLAAHLPGRQLLLHQRAAAGLADRHLVQSGGVPHQRLPLELLRGLRRERGGEPGHDGAVFGRVPGDGVVDFQDGVPAEELRRSGAAS